MTAANIQSSLAGGEISQSLYARVDLDKFDVGMALVRNFIVDYRGGVKNRPGFRFFVEANTAVAGSKRLSSFIVSTEAAYLMEIGGGYIRLYNQGVFIADVVTPYQAVDIWALKFTQSADVMTIVHPSYSPANLTRTSDTTFTYTTIIAGAKVEPPLLTDATAPVTGDYAYSYISTAVSLDGREESRPSNIVVIKSAILNETANTVVGLKLDPDPDTPAARFNYYKWGPQDHDDFPPATVWGYIGSSVAGNFVDNNIAPNFGQQAPVVGDPFNGGQVQAIRVLTGGTGYGGTGDWPTIPYVGLTIVGDGGGAFGYAVIDPSTGEIASAYVTYPGANYTAVTITAGAGGATFAATLSDPAPLYPSCVSYLQQRRMYAGSNVLPSSFALSQIGKFDNFDTTPSSLATDAISGTVSAQQVNAIRSLVPVSYGVLAFTSAGCFLINGGSPGASVTPESISVTQQASPGANGLQPLLVNYDVLFVQAKGTRIRNASFAWEKQSFTVGDITQLAPHLFDEYDIVDWTYAEEPDKLLWVVRNDGRLLSCTYVPEQQVYAWARHDTQGLFKSIVIVPENDTNAVYVIVERHVDQDDGTACWVQYIERLSIRHDCCLVNARFLDSNVEINRQVGGVPIWLTRDDPEDPTSVLITSYDPCVIPPTPGPFDPGGGGVDGNFVASADVTPPSGVTMPTGNRQRNADAWGSMWGAGGPSNNYIQAWDATGALIYSEEWGTVWDQIRTFVLANSTSSGWSATGGGKGDLAFLTYQGATYLLFHGLFYQGGFLYDEGIAVCSTLADGTITVLGVTWTAPGGIGITGDDMATSTIDIMGLKSMSDPVMTWQNRELNVGWGKAWPSINTIIADVCSVFDSTRYIPAPFAAPGDEYYNFGLQQSNGQQVFNLPRPGGTNTFMYLSRAWMEYNHAQANPTPFVEDQYGAHPNGFMAVMDFGVAVAPTTKTVPNSYACGDDSITAATSFGVFNDTNGDPYDALPDTGEYLDGTTGTFSTLNDFLLTPHIRNVGFAGDFTILWYEPFLSNNTYTGADPDLVFRIRRQAWNPALGVFQDFDVIEGGFTLFSEMGGIGSSNTPYTVQTINWGAYVVGDYLYVWNFNGDGFANAGRRRAWLYRLRLTDDAPVIIEGDVIQLDCGKIRVDAVTDSNTIEGTIIGDVSEFELPDDPDGVLVPIPAAEWTVVTPTDIITGLEHLENKEVWALADGVVVGPLTVSGGQVDVGTPVSSCCVGLRYTSQLKSLYLTMEGLNQGTEQGKRKKVNGITLRTDCTRGLSAGDIDFTKVVPVPELNSTSPLVVFTGDARVISYPSWNKYGQIFVQQTDPLPAQVLGIIIEVTSGDTQR